MPAVLAELRSGRHRRSKHAARWRSKAFAHTAHYDSAISAYLNPAGQPDPGSGFTRCRTCATAKTRTSPRRCMPTSPAPARWAGRSCRAKNSPITTCSIWMPPGGLWSVMPARPSASSSIFRPAASPPPIAGRRLHRRPWPATRSPPLAGSIASNQPVRWRDRRSHRQPVRRMHHRARLQPGSAARSWRRRRTAPGGDARPARSNPDSSCARSPAACCSRAIDLGDPAGTEWKVVSPRQPTREEWTALRFAWKACQHVKSNAIVFAQGEATVGIGGGQPNRVDCVRIAVQRAGETRPGRRDGLGCLLPLPRFGRSRRRRPGSPPSIHPGGSMRDAESIAAADAAGMAMVTTGVRHFRH